ncbi:efflux RND transporter permease subunit [Roseitranquillus sediminis]|uniref:efflux RND transporter permease subunit n=1 Tax=Roseitranquillus sediminis TaxID=2809051 RepID=UPI001D0C9EC3|nr:efflux RND transporter permease subunit [Roseitranquillus sediminis]MBM9593338.1 efflux RND transporter permease subunit [Roseitranquillus sediminis]
MGGGILAYFARHRTAANLLLVLMVALGVAAFPQMRAQFFPDVVIDEIDVDVTWSGAGAEDVDSGIVQLLEPVLLAVEGVVETESRSSEGRASIEVEFEPGWDMSRAAEDVQAAVDGVNNLPEEAEEPRVGRGGWRDRVTDVVITGPVGVEQLGRYADEFVARLFAEGVTRTTIRGLAAPETLVEVPSLSLIRHGLTLREIADAVAAAASVNPAGEVSGAARLRTGSERRTADELADVVLRSNPDGSSLTVGDVATIRTLGADRNAAFFVGGDPAVTVRVDRSDRGDAIDIQRQVEEVAAEMEPTLPAGVTIDLINTRAEMITGRLQILLDNGLMGLGLVVCLLFLFLNARTAFWVAAGIPVAMTAAIAIMYLAGLTLNMISLFALIITLGIVVDDAIVVGEHADFRARRLREPPVVAAENAARRMFLPVFSATLTTVIAFFGLVTIGGRFGELIADIPFTVIVVLLASLIECFLILPAHMAHALTHTAKEHWYDWPSRQVNRGFRWVRDRLFRPMMAGVVVLRYPVVAVMVLLLASQAALFIRGDVQWRFFSSPEESSISGNFAMVPDATRSDTMEMLRLIQRTVDELGAAYEAEHGRNPLAHVLAQIGGGAGRGLAGADTKEPDQLGAISVELIDTDLRPYSSSAFLADLQERVPPHPKLETLSFRGWRGGPGGDSLDVELSGADAPTLKAAAEALKARAAQFPEVSALEDTLAYDKDELVLELTPQGQALGFTIDALGRTLRDRLSGIEAATYPEGIRSAAIRVELPEAELTADFLDRTMLRTAAGDYVPLVDIVTVESRHGFSTIRRENGVRVVSVLGDISEDDPARAQAVQDALRDEILPAIEAEFGISTRLAGLAEQESEFLSEAAVGLIMCLAGIYIVLTFIFASWSRPLVVMAIIPFGLVGAIWGHYLWQVPMNIFSVVGLIGMVGIIINDSIVLVTTIDEYGRERGIIPAIIDGAADRLRPVLLTTLTTVLGLAPLLYESSQQAQFLKPTVITLVFGLGFGMVLVLMLVPALMATQEDARRARTAMRRSLSARGRSARLATLAGLAAAAVLFAVTILPVMVSGGALAPLAALAPSLPPLAVACSAFAAGLLAVLFAIYLAAGLAGGALRRG